ncbi:secreted RxLR effector protein 161-like isoform X1 [Mangifera indica]|uniref:secreted RxLR effector protein 161-like isoform X1 n=1 Tax=Mangifera indica TaxID=29780 RepID=UPI001CF98E1A|nr:secreted RxLR effector protein 161-like isoform X1 [Mangifera indica]
MQDSKSYKTPMAANTKLFIGDSEPYSDPTQYRSTIGALQYLTMTRPDLSFVVNKLSQFLKNPSQLQWQACKRVLRYIKGTLSFGLLIKPAKCFSIKVYIDADWAGNLSDRRSTSGFAMYFGGNLVQWGSRKQRVGALSSTEAEYRAVSEASTEIAWLNSLLNELKLQCFSVPIIWCDNLSAGSLASNAVLHSRTKHIEIDIHFVREQVTAKRLKV